MLTDARLQQEGVNSLMYHGCHLGHVACAISASVVCRGQKIRASSMSEKWNDCTVNIDGYGWLSRVPKIGCGDLLFKKSRFVPYVFHFVTMLDLI